METVELKRFYLEHGTRVNTRVHDDPFSLESSDSQAEPHLSSLPTISDSVLDVTVSRETQGVFTYILTEVVMQKRL